MASNVSLRNVQEVIEKVTHPAIDRTLVALGMIKNVRLQGNKVKLTLTLPFLNIPATVKDSLVNSLVEAVASLGLKLEVEIAEMNEKELRAFLAKEQESWKAF